MTKLRTTRAQRHALRLICRKLRDHHAGNRFPRRWTRLRVENLANGHVMLSGCYEPDSLALAALDRCSYNFFVGPRGGISTYTGRPNARGYAQMRDTRRSIRSWQVPFAGF